MFKKQKQSLNYRWELQSSWVVEFNGHQQRRDRASHKHRTATEALGITHDNSRKIVGNTVSTMSNQHKRDKARGMCVTNM